MRLLSLQSRWDRVSQAWRLRRLRAAGTWRAEGGEKHLANQGLSSRITARISCPVVRALGPLRIRRLSALPGTGTTTTTPRELYSLYAGLGRLCTAVLTLYLVYSFTSPTQSMLVVVAHIAGTMDSLNGFNGFISPTAHNVAPCPIPTSHCPAAVRKMPFGLLEVQTGTGTRPQGNNVDRKSVV